MQRVSVFVDGFNLYHALLKLRDNRAKWLDLAALSRRLVLSQSETVVSVYYFTAIAHWLQGPAARHQRYLAALRSTGVVPVLGHFKNKDRGCRACGATWVGHEEKETDVNIALYMLRGAYRDEYDKALVVSRDFDLVPAVSMLRADFPQKQVVAVAPPLMGHSNDLIRVSSGKKKITPDQVRQSLLPDRLTDSTGAVVAIRPAEYA